MSPLRIRLSAAALAIAGVLFLLYPVFRPWHDETTTAGAQASMGSDNWVAAHAFAMFGFILLPLGLIALRSLVTGTRGEPAAAWAWVLAWVGGGLVLPYYGAEDFGLHTLAGPDGQGVDLLKAVDGVRYQPVAITMFGVGLVALAIAGVLGAVAAWRGRVGARWVGIPLGLGLLLFLPQFYTPAAMRIGHGGLMALGAIVLAVALWNGAARERTLA